MRCVMPPMAHLILRYTAGSLIKHGEIKNAVRKNIVPAGEFFLSLLANETQLGWTTPVSGNNEPKRLPGWVQKPAIEALLAKQILKPLLYLATARYFTPKGNHPSR